MGLAAAFSISQTTEGKQNAQQEFIALVHPQNIGDRCLEGQRTCYTLGNGTGVAHVQHRAPRTRSVWTVL